MLFFSKKRNIDYEKLKGLKLTKEQKKRINKIINEKNPKNSTQSMLFFDEILKNGICKIGDTYSKTVKFFDINYMLANNEDKAKIFNLYCEFLNYFNEKIKVQLTFFNQKTNGNELLDKIHIQSKNDNIEHLRKEYYQMLKNQLEKGNNGIVKLKYLTFSVEEESYKKAKQILERIELDVINNFKTMGVSAESLNGFERLELIHNILNKDEKFSFDFDDFLPLEEKVYSFEEIEKQKDVINSRVAYSGSERVRDIVNDYDKITYTLPYFIENDYFKISYKVGEGVTSFYNKKENREMLLDGDAKFFTPIYENTEIRTDVYEERRRLGRNIRGLHSKKYIAQLDDIKIKDNGKIFKTIELIYKLEGTYFSSVIIRLYNDLPRVDFKYKIAKTFNEGIENILLPLALDLGNKETFIDKGKVPFKPGVEQIDGTCMEYYLLDTGVLYKGEKSNIAINTLDAPMIYMGNLDHHPIVLCDKKEENNKRNVYSWIMNNIWETNFKMDLSGATEFCYSLTMEDSNNVDDIFNSMRNDYGRVVTFMI